MVGRIASALVELFPKHKKKMDMNEVKSQMCVAFKI